MQNLCLEFADKILIFAVLRWRHLQWRETEASFVCFVIVAGLLGKIASSVGRDSKVQWGNVRHRAKLRGNWSNRCTDRDTAILRF